MALETKINRIQTNVANALAALAEKGVTVPSGANSDDLETLIKAIESGSGGKIVSGSFTPTTEGKDAQTVTHNLGKIPNFVIFFKDSNGVATNSHLSGGWIDSIGFTSGAAGGGGAQYTKNNYDITASTGDGAHGATSSKVTLETYNFFRAGETYKWYVGVI